MPPLIRRPPPAPAVDLPKQGPLSVFETIAAGLQGALGVNEPERGDFRDEAAFQTAAKPYAAGTLASVLAPIIAMAGLKVYHGSRRGIAPNIESGRPFYTTPDRALAQGYAEEAVHTGKGAAPHISEYHLDPSKYITRDDYLKILHKHLPGDAMLDQYPSEAATVGHPSILAELQRKGIKGVRDLWDFGMDGRTERQVIVTLDPSTLKVNK